MKKRICNTLTFIGTLSLASICASSLWLVIAGLTTTVICFGTVYKLCPDWGFEYDRNGNVVE